MIVDPASAPTPIESVFWASSTSPRPEKSIMAPSGTAPRRGSTTPPTRPARDGTRRRRSDPSEMRLDAA